ncbi:diphosphate--fructose-6-phosphate 1-phosphotransferase [Desulfoferrobacter suflitae]|uniref:diphosphate--fructose-6-phosphate 1-phosphotransferase n=1 Tax=Desulfoferrobacter suflitae TaxID=2865782 RepID=UPI00216497FE|nr:diphosphate--fructose-6-phosphate 1-phosphotransferase [Desulfoferrobacter suflitae]MCK8602772.1 diphosphate--fructose-6-phosphate 1-phosphotransferase [Desulfoferrobacter suflitae]
MASDQFNPSFNSLEHFHSTAGKHSIFEDEIRKLPIPVCSVFVSQEGRIAPAVFKETDMIFQCEDHGRTSKEFTRSIEKSKDIVLQAFPGKSAPRIDGKRVAVLFSGGPAAGGHNVLAGLKAVLGRDGTLLGIRKGPKGLINGDLFEINSEQIRAIINTGGFDFLGTDRTKVKTAEQFAKVKATAVNNKLDGLIIIGGDDSNTNAAYIAEYFLREGVDCSVVGIPKTIDGDMAVGKYLPISFGFDTATKVYSELVGNLTQDAASAVKYYHFVKLMGRTASKITLEVALQTKPAITLISEEIAEKHMSLESVVEYVADIIAKRRLKGINHGVVLVPEGLIEFIPEMKSLIQELNHVLAEYERDIKDLPTLKNKQEYIYPLLTPQSAQLMASLPDDIEEMLILDRDDHGNVKVSQIETEKLLIEKIRYRMSQLKRHTHRFFGDGEGKIEATDRQIEQFKAASFSTQSHFLGYEGRSAKPTAFDAAFTFNLGLAAGSLVLQGKTGYMASVTDFDKGGRVLALPISGLIACETRKGREELVIAKDLVNTSSPAFKVFAKNRDKWAMDDLFSSPGPIQHWGPTSRQMPISVALNQGYTGYQSFDLGEERVVGVD